MIFGGTIGVVGKMKDGWWEANVDARLNKYKVDATAQPDSGAASTFSDENDGGFEINANVKGFFMVSKPYKVSLVPYAGFGMFNWNPNITTGPTATTTPQPEYKWLNIRGGVGINMPILDEGMLAGGLSFGMTTSELNGVTTFGEGTDTTVTDSKTTTMNFPQFNVGGEWKFNEWLTGRLGYARAVQRVTLETTTQRTSGGTTTTSTREENVTNATDPNHTITVGLGWHFGRFSLDGLIGERFFQGGPFLVGGKTNDLYGILSASYNFNK
jgi:hypothetical protein